MTVRILQGDCRETLKTLADGSVNCCVTSPPYFGLRDYGCAGQIGLEQTPEQFIAELVAVFREVRRVLRDDGTLWVNMGDSYGRNPAKGGTGTENGRNTAEMRYAGGGRPCGKLRLRPGLTVGERRMVLAHLGIALSAGPEPLVPVGRINDQLLCGLGRVGLNFVLDDLCDDVAQSLLLRASAVPPALQGYFVAAGTKEKDLIGVPWMLAFALRADGWYLRQDIIWSKPNPMPESVRDRCTKAHEYLFLLSKSPRYYYDADAIAEAVSDTSLARWAQPNIAEQAGSDRVPGKTNGAMRAVGGPQRAQAQRAVELARTAGLTQEHIDAIRSVGITDTGKARVTQDGTGRNDARIQALADEAKAALGGYYREFLIAEKRNKRSVWEVSTQPFAEAHFATFPPALIEPCILAGVPAGGTVLDPFGGAGTTGLVADRLQRNALLCELNPAYIEIAERRIRGDAPLFADLEAA